MKKKINKVSLEADTLSNPKVDDICELTLYVVGQTPRGLTALATLKKLCEEHLKGLYRLEVVDLVESPQKAREDEILAIPTVVRKVPLPIRKIIGDLSNNESVLKFLQLPLLKP